MDLDNTIISYDRVFHAEATRRGLLSGCVPVEKQAVRDHLRLTPQGEIEWQEIQAAVYGPLIDSAELIPGVVGFFEFCASTGISTVIISHKTEFATYDRTNTNLRVAALKWLRGRLFCRTSGVVESDVHFATTRGKKVGLIGDCACTHFIDDLVEVFQEPEFPEGVFKYLFDPSGTTQCACDINTVRSWDEFRSHFE